MFQWAGMSSVKEPEEPVRPSISLNEMERKITEDPETDGTIECLIHQNLPPVSQCLIRDS